MKAHRKITNQEMINGKFLTTIRNQYADSKENYTQYIVSNIEIDVFNVNSQFWSDTTFRSKKRAIEFCK